MTTNALAKAFKRRLFEKRPVPRIMDGQLRGNEGVFQINGYDRAGIWISDRRFVMALFIKGLVSFVRLAVSSWYQTIGYFSYSFEKLPQCG